MSASSVSKPPRPPISPAEALRRFDQTQFRHPTLDAARTELVRYLDPGMPPSLITLEGSTGVGKTTVSNVVSRDVRKGETGPSHPEPGRVVNLNCPIPGPNGLAFDQVFWGTVDERAGSPTPGTHRHPDVEAARLSGGFVKGMRRTIESKRCGTLKLLWACGVRLVVIDEAQHITETRGGQALTRHLNIIKNSVDESGITFLLVGTYALRALVLPNGQLGRRTNTVHFRPYHPDVPGDLDAYRTFLLQLAGALPLRDPEACQAQVDRHVEEILFYTAGCVGVLKGWMRLALKLALEREKNFIPWKYMDEARPKDHTLLNIASDIRAYRDEQALATRSKIEEKLGYGPTPRSSRQTRKPTQSSNSSTKGRTKPGSRGPARDPVHPSPPANNL